MFNLRFIHISAMYKYIHSVHHRNTDIEPFAGLSMHPVEHLYYFSCLGPSFLVHTTPFAFMQDIFHLTGPTGLRIRLKVWTDNATNMTIDDKNLDTLKLSRVTLGLI